MQGILYEEPSALTFALITFVMGGWTAWRTGRAAAESWSDLGVLVTYVALLGVAIRFIHHALFAGTFLSMRLISEELRSGTIETLLTFSSTYASQPAANTVLTNFGATAVAMLDGGGSTGLVIDGTTYIAPQRTVPHALVIYSR